MKKEIRIANESDAGIISIIGRKAFRKAFAGFFRLKEDLERYLDYTYTTEKITRSISKANNVYLLAIVDGRPVGFIKMKKYSLNSLITSVWQSELQKIYILPEFQGKGIGQMLIEEVIELAAGLRPDYLWLDVLKANKGARKLYERMGFTVAGDHSFMIGSQMFEYYVMKRFIGEGTAQCQGAETEILSPAK